MVGSLSIIGVLNITPDSFYDGGQIATVEDAVALARHMIAGGADILEIGGESTGPGSKDVSKDEELQRVLPVLEAVHAAFPSVPLSIDTYKSAVAELALQRGATMINDVTAGRSDSQIFAVAAKHNASIVLMYAKDPSPRTTVEDRQYDDVVSQIIEFLTARKQAAVDAGIDAARIILDPGLGQFISSDPDYSFRIIARLRDFQLIGCPLLVSPSRKSFLAGSEQLPSGDRLPATIAASAIAVLHGAAYIRTHDVPEVRRGCEIAGRISNQR